MTNYVESYPHSRLRRNRKAEWLRNLIAQNAISPNDLILPIFVIEGKNKQQKVSNLEGVWRFSIDLAIKQAKKAAKLGINAIMLFPVIEQKLKDSNGSQAIKADNLMCRAIKEIKNAVPEIGIIGDIALDPYTNHGHDGILGKDNSPENDKTIDILCQQALVQAKAGCDILAPSDMMDGRIGLIRQTLDKHDFSNVNLMSYAAKYASNFYGPFRDAVGSKSNLKNVSKATYQMDFRNSDEAMREIALDIKEGADLIIIKPGISYLDIIYQANSNFKLPIIAYQVSGEYMALKYAAKNGAFDFMTALYESLIAFKRAGATAIICYGALEVCAKY